MPWPLFTPTKDPAPIVQEAWWAPRPVWRGVENLTTIGIRSPDRPARSQSLYQLHYPAHLLKCTCDKMCAWYIKTDIDFKNKDHHTVYQRLCGAGETFQF
jgi:hypothetical protein